MKTITRLNSTSIEVNNSIEGETIEDKVNRILNNGEPITDGAPIIYTERRQGIMPENNPRTDRFDIAIDAMDVVTKTKQAKRDDAYEKRKEALKKADEVAKGQPTQGTGGDSESS